MSNGNAISSTTLFEIGQIVLHRLFDYRGVVLDVDADFQGREEWYRQVARSRPPKNKPWYHVPVHALVVEHDMAFVRQLGAPITVLHYGRVFAQGSLAEIESHEEVRQIYLGTTNLGQRRRRRKTNKSTGLGEQS